MEDEAGDLDLLGLAFLGVVGEGGAGGEESGVGEAERERLTSICLVSAVFCACTLSILSKLIISNN